MGCVCVSFVCFVSVVMVFSSGGERGGGGGVKMVFACFRAREQDI